MIGYKNYEKYMEKKEKKKYRVKAYISSFHNDVLYRIEKRFLYILWIPTQLDYGSKQKAINECNKLNEIIN